jgi:hypothetical protein
VTSEGERDRAHQPADPLAGVTVRVSPDEAVVQGFDHHHAWTIGMYVVLACPFVLPYGWAWFGLLPTLSWTVVFLLVSCVVARLLRFTLRIDAVTVQVSRSWLGIEYARVSAPVDEVKVAVSGAGDWGDEGDWPMQRYCEVELGNGVEVIGSPAAAHGIQGFVAAQLAKRREGQPASESRTPPPAA